MKLHLLLLIALLSFIPHTLHAQIQGTWHSNFQVAGKSLLMDLQVEGIGRDGSITVSIPDEPKLKPQTMEAYALFSDSVWFNWKMLKRIPCCAATSPSITMSFICHFEIHFSACSVNILS